VKDGAKLIENGLSECLSTILWSQQRADRLRLRGELLVRTQLAIALVGGSLLTAPLWPQSEVPPKLTQDAPSVSGADVASIASANESVHAVHSMEGHGMAPGAHIKLTPLADPKPGDEERAAEVLAAARKLSERYKDYKAALADGYQIFLPNIPQRQYHFTNYRYAFEAEMHFNADQPTSLLYEKHGEGYSFVGVMYTAAKNASEEELDSRVPLSVAQWHAHVNLCLPPQERKKEAWGFEPKYGLAGSIATKADCEAAGGKFVPQIFGWMVHVYPLGQTAEDIWSVEKRAGNE